jgi:hypothetical protein
MPDKAEAEQQRVTRRWFMKQAWVSSGLALIRVGPVLASGIGPGLADLTRETPEQLLQRYRQGWVHVPPTGFVRGLALVGPGTSAGPLLSGAARAVWQGKRIRPDGSAVNRFFGVPAVRGRLGIAPSWLDGAPTLVLDYRQTSWIYCRYRDEIRQIAPGLWLGVMIDAESCPPRVVRYFALWSEESAICG